MPIPKEILEVQRPVNTVVAVYGKNKDRYAVKQRIGCKRVNGKNIPITGPTIGHIIDRKYVPKETVKPVSVSPVDMLDWAIIEYTHRFGEPLMSELRKQYKQEDAEKILCIALLRVCYPGIKDNELKNAYEESFLSIIYPNVALSNYRKIQYLDFLRTWERHIPEL